MELLDRVWLAAVIDCEGSLSLGRRVHRNGVIRYSASVHLVNTYRPLMERASRLMGMQMHGQRLSALSRKPLMQVSIGSQAKVEALLRATCPYLMEKRAFAEVLLDWIEFVRARPSVDAAYRERGETIRALYMPRTQLEAA